MKILEVIPSLASGGAERFVVDLCNQMVKDGHDVTLLTVKDLTILNNGFYLGELSTDVRHHNLGLGKFGFSTFYRLFKAIKEIDADIVHIHLIPVFCFYSFIFDRKKKYVVTSHIQAENEKKSSLKYVVKKTCLKLGVLHQVAISLQNKQSNIDVYGVVPVLIYNGRAKVCQTVEIENVKKEITLFKKNQETLVFTMIARCSPQKNIPRLIRCFNKLIESGENITLLVIGNGYDSPDFQPFVKQANKQIHFLGQRHNISDYLYLSDFFTLSSDFEGMPITLIEAFACGCIPVGTPVSGFNDVVIDGVNGFVADALNDKAYMNALKRAISHKNDIKKSTLFEIYENKLSMKSCASQYERLFNSLLLK